MQHTHTMHVCNAHQIHVHMGRTNMPKKLYITTHTHAHKQSMGCTSHHVHNAHNTPMHFTPLTKCMDKTPYTQAHIHMQHSRSLHAHMCHQKKKQKQKQATQAPHHNTQALCHVHNTYDTCTSHAISMHTYMNINTSRTHMHM